MPNINSEEQLLDVAQLLYRINKHSLALKCHHKETMEVVHRNMRMGIGVTGVMQATEEQNRWLSSVYESLREYDKEYSKLHGFNESIKLTTVKPSGTLSLLAGVTPGAHPGYSHYFVRRIRMARDSELVTKCIDNGYHVESVRNFDGTEDNNTVVVEFPCSFPKYAVIAEQVSAIDQLNNVKKLQTEWSDNSVSCTIYYKKEELPEIKEWLKDNYTDSVKTCSFLLHSDHGFDQAPYEEITKEEYDKLKAATTPLTELEIDEDDMEIDECATGSCPIK